MCVALVMLIYCATQFRFFSPNLREWFSDFIRLLLLLSPPPPPAPTLLYPPAAPSAAPPAAPRPARPSYIAPLPQPFCMVLGLAASGPPLPL